MNNEIKEFIVKMNSSNSNNEKLSILTSYENNTLIKDILFYTYNPFINYHLTSENLIKNNNIVVNTDLDLFSILNILSKRQKTGHDAIGIVNGLIKNNIDYKDIIYKIIDKNLEIRIDIKTINKVFSNLIPTYDVALANKLDDKLKNSINWKTEHWLASRKLDGIRCEMIVDENYNVTSFSREGKEIETLTTLKKYIYDICISNKISNVVFDGEICIINEKGEDDFQGIMKQIRKKNHDIINAKYYIFDFLNKIDFENQTSKETFSERLLKLNNLNYNNDKIIVLPQYDFDMYIDYEKWNKLVSDNNWEGFMLRKNTIYKGKRSNDILKVKIFFDNEYIVKKIETGNFRVINKETKLEEVIETLTNVIIEHKGYEVSVGSGFSLEQRKLYYNNPTLLLNKNITVSYFEETLDQNNKISLRFPTFKGIRELI